MALRCQPCIHGRSPGGALALRVHCTLLHFPPKSRKQTPSKCAQNKATLASLAEHSCVLPHLPIRHHEMMSLGSFTPFGIPNKNIRQCHKGQKTIFPPIESRQQHHSSKTTHDAHLPTMHPQILGLLFVRWLIFICRLVNMPIFNPDSCIRHRMQISRGECIVPALRAATVGRNQPRK